MNADFIRDLQAVAAAPPPLIVVRVIVNEKGLPEKEIPRGRTYVQPHPLNPRKEPS